MNFQSTGRPCTSVAGPTFTISAKFHQTIQNCGGWTNFTTLAGFGRNIPLSVIPQISKKSFSAAAEDPGLCRFHNYSKLQFTNNSFLFEAFLNNLTIDKIKHNQLNLSHSPRYLRRCQRIAAAPRSVAWEQTNAQLAIKKIKQGHKELNGKKGTDFTWFDSKWKNENEVCTAKAPKKIPMAAPQVKLADTRGWEFWNVALVQIFNWIHGWKLEVSWP